MYLIVIRNEEDSNIIHSFITREPNTMAGK